MAANHVPDFDDMHDIVVSDPISWWPLAPGWYVLILVLAMAVIWFGVTTFKQWKKNSYRREALRELRDISPTELPALIKRVALSAWSREEVATLSGDAWLQFLDRSGNTTEFTQGAGKLLLDISYNPHSQINNNSPEYQQLLNLVRRWIQQ